MADVLVETRYGAVQKAVLAGLMDHNAKAVGRRRWRTLAVSVREKGEIRGGAVGEVWFGWLFVKLLWLDERVRGVALGKRALLALEDQARELGATQAYLDTFSFQAPGFYRKPGYREFGRLDDYPKGHCRLWLTKAL